MGRQRAVVEESKSKEKIKRNGHRHKDLSDPSSQSESEYDFVTPKVSNGGDQCQDRKQRSLMRNQQSENGSIHMSTNGNLNTTTEEK